MKHSIVVTYAISNPHKHASYEMAWLSFYRGGKNGSEKLKASLLSTQVTWHRTGTSTDPEPSENAWQ